MLRVWTAWIALTVVACVANFGGAFAFTNLTPAHTVFKSNDLLGDSRRSNHEWNEFFHSPDGLIQSGNAYTITFNYRVIDRAGDANFYTLLRSKSHSGGDLRQQEWRNNTGESGNIRLSVFGYSAADYYLIIGIKGKGAIAIQGLKIETDPSNIPINLPSPAPKRSWHSKGNSKYYVDSKTGDDTLSGESPATAWRSLEKINSGTLAPGDHVFLKCDSNWTGCFLPNGKGTAEEPIIIDKYGQGSKPRIDANEETYATMRLYNSEYIEVRNLELTNAGPIHQPGLTAVEVKAQDFGVAHHIVLTNLDIHDVTGCTSKHGGGQAIVCLNGGKNIKSCFEDLVIEGCHISHVDRDGITMYANYNRDDWFPNLHVVIRDNHLEDIGGDGIVPSNCDGALVERNVLKGGRMRAPDSAAGIWPGSCDNTLVQYNEVSGMNGIADGEGFDSDWNCRNSLFQYNFSHDNDGGFMLICNDGDVGMPKNIGNSNTVVRYNISVNDKLHTFNITGPCNNTKIYNNTIFIGRGRNQMLVCGGNWGKAYPDGLRFSNNIFYVDTNSDAEFKLGGISNVTFDCNCFWGHFTNPPDNNDQAISGNPNMIAPGRLRVDGYKLKRRSLCLNAGVRTFPAQLKDFQGDLIPPNSKPSIGAFQNPVDAE